MRVMGEARFSLNLVLNGGVIVRHVDAEGQVTLIADGPLPGMLTSNVDVPDVGGGGYKARDLEREMGRAFALIGRDMTGTGEAAEQVDAIVRETQRLVGDAMDRWRRETRTGGGLILPGGLN